MIEGGEVKDKTLHGAATAAGGGGAGVQSWKGWNCDCGVGVGGHGQGLVRSWKGSRGPSGKRTGWVLQLRGKG